jgi:hypothetical protein
MVSRRSSHYTTPTFVDILVTEMEKPLDLEVAEMYPVPLMTRRVIAEVLAVQAGIGWLERSDSWHAHLQTDAVALL